MKLTKKELYFYLVMLAVTVVVKLVCAPRFEFSGFSAVFSVALFGGMMAAEHRHNIIMPLVMLLLSDVVLQVLYLADLFPFPGFYKGQPIIYSLFVLLTLFGLLFRHAGRAGVFTAAALGPTLFFLVSNFMVWARNGGIEGSITYSRDLQGLLTCYTAALPFYKNSLMATLVFLPGFVYMYKMMVKGLAKAS